MFGNSIQLSLAVLTAVAANPASADMGVYPPPQALRLVEIALECNPGLASARLGSEAALAEASTRRAWPAPEAAVEFFKAPVSSFPNPLPKEQHEIDYSLTQKFPFPGKRGAQSLPARRRAEAQEMYAESEALTIRRRVLAAFADLYAAQWKLRLSREDRSETDRLLSAARAGYEGGLGSQSDLLRAETETARLDAEILDWKRMETETRAMLSVLLGGPTEGLLPDFADSLAPAHIRLSRDDLKTLALERRPDLEAMRREKSATDAVLAAADKEILPDFMVRGMYKQMRHAPEDDWSLMIGMEIPIAPWTFRGVRAESRRARALRDQAGHDYASMHFMAEAEVESAAAALEAAWDRLELAKNRRIPLAAQSLRAALAAYQGGKIGFGDVLLAFRELRLAREAYHLGVSDHLKAWAALEWAVGGALPVKGGGR
jgi:outer membrane protein TolC